MNSTQHLAHSTQRRQHARTVSAGMVIVIAMTGISVVRLCAAERTWTRSEILAVADKEAQRLGYDIERMGVSFDVWNSQWNDHLESNERIQILDETSGQFRPQTADELQEMKQKLLSDFDGRDYWAIYYAPLETRLGGNLFVFVDRSTGEVIKSIGGE